jgi:signal peptidase II
VLQLVLRYVLPVLVADQVLKIWVKLHFAIGDRVALIPGLIEMQFIENEGMAFGWALPGAAGKLALTGFRLLASVAIGFYLARLLKEKAHPGLCVATAFVWAGAMGNIVDSAFYGMLFSASHWGIYADFLPAEGGYAPLLMGKVVDMFHFTVRWPECFPIGSMAGREVFPPIWNIADAAISCGVIWILLRQKTYFASPAED